MRFRNVNANHKSLEVKLGSGQCCDKITAVSKNMLLTENGYKSRPGVLTPENSVVFRPDEYTEFSEFQLTELSVLINGRSARLAVAAETDERSYIYYHISAIFSNGSRKSLGYIPFRRSSSYSFARPYSYVVYAGKKTAGAGIYFLARLSGPEGDELRIFELNSNETDWTLIPNSRFYIPTLFMNGRGDRAAAAMQQSNLRLSSPRALEPLNRLCGSFNCHYTTDGLSGGFTLPECPSSPETIICRFKDEYGEIFEWILNSQNIYTAEVSMNGKAIRAEFESFSNKIYFRHSDLTIYPLPHTGGENNLSISVRALNNPECLAATTVTAACNTSAVSTSGSSAVTVFYGSIQSPEEMFWINPENPLYFPQGCSIKLSVPTHIGNKLFALNNRIYLLSSNLIISAKATSAKPYNIRSIVNGTSFEGVIMPSLSFDKQITLPEEIASKTVAHSGEEIYFCTKNGRINRISPSLSISSYKTRLPLLPKAAAVTESGYLLIYDDLIKLFEPLNNRLSDWSIPVPLLTGCEVGGITVLLGKSPSDSIYCFTLSGDRDIYYGNTENEPLINTPVASELILSFPSLREGARLYELWSDAVFEGKATAELFDGRSKVCHYHFYRDNTAIRRPLFFRLLSVRLCFSEYADIRGINIKYFGR